MKLMRLHCSHDERSQIRKGCPSDWNWTNDDFDLLDETPQGRKGRKRVVLMRRIVMLRMLLVVMRMVVMMLKWILL